MTKGYAYKRMAIIRYLYILALEEIPGVRDMFSMEPPQITWIIMETYIKVCQTGMEDGWGKYGASFSGKKMERVSNNMTKSLEEQ